ncbi:xylulokinase [Parafrankia irregularis]|uniref:Xylulose kinase n=1 Tax=Parafrankia irregularis TaxID=795642 RepID=A0A0S4QJ89_9ACTN|nr:MULTISPECIES: FGGY family carbohydrate kinase [Parafrankia]MBE3200738.1 xylulose kinase [Parafrankia sp. CH37]CUU54876.1 xylulokinase [Parafrankia irregularis]
MTLVAGVDSSTQSCKVVIREAGSGRFVRAGSAPHPDGTELDPEHWWTALRTAADRAGGLGDVAAISVAGQQHGMICLDSDGDVIRPALLWNDTRSAQAARDLVTDLGGGDPAAGAAAWAGAVGSVPVASFTVAKLRWLADHEPDAAVRIAAIALPHDWLTWRLAGARSLDTLRTDRSDASGTGYYDASAGTADVPDGATGTSGRAADAFGGHPAPAGGYRRDLLALALRRTPGETARIRLPEVAAPGEAVGRGDPGAGLGHLLLGPGCGDNAGAALGLGLRPGACLLSLGTSGVVAAVSRVGTRDASGAVAGFADATGHHLPLACTLNASRVLDVTRRLLEVDHDTLDTLALRAEPGAGGLVFVPYLEGERTPNLPTATGSLHGLSLASTTRENLARASVEGLLCLMAECVDVMRAQNVDVGRVTMVGGGARSRAVRALAPAVLGVPVAIPSPGEYVADGAARQAAAVLLAGQPDWPAVDAATHTAPPCPEIREKYRAAAALAAEDATASAV